MVGILDLVGQALACLERNVFAPEADASHLLDFKLLCLLFAWDRLEGAFAVVVAVRP